MMGTDGYLDWMIPKDEDGKDELALFCSLHVSVAYFSLLSPILSIIHHQEYHQKSW